MREWFSHAVSLANEHYTAEGNLSRTAPKAWRFVLPDSQLQLDYGVGTFLLRISSVIELFLSFPEVIPGAEDSDQVGKRFEQDIYACIK